MFKTTFKGYVPKLKLKGAEATIVEGKAIESKGGSIRYTLRGEYEGHATLPKTVSKHDFENVYGFDAKEAEAVIITGKEAIGMGKKDVVKGFIKGKEDKDDFTPNQIVTFPHEIGTANLENHADTAGDPPAAIIYGEKEGNPVGYIHVVGHEDKRGVTPTDIHTGTSGISPEEMVKVINRTRPKAADTVGSPSPADVEPPAPSEKPFPQEPSNENFSAENVRTGITDDGKTAYEWYVVEGDESITDNNGEPLIRPYDEEEITNEIEYYVNHFVGQGELSDSESLRLHEIVDSHDRFDEPMEYTIAYSWKPVEVKEAFGLFGKKDEEEAEPEEPKTQEFTVVLQEGDKLELTDIEGNEETGDDTKGENSDEDSENEEKAAEKNCGCGQDPCITYGAEYEAVQAKVTRPVKEEEKEEVKDDEEGSVDLGTIATVGAIGLGALAIGSMFGAEDEGESDYWAGENAYWRAEGGDADSTVVWELIQQNLNNPDTVRLYYEIMGFGDPDEYEGDDMATTVAEGFQQNSQNQEFINYLSQQLGFEAEGTGHVEIDMPAEKGFFWTTEPHPHKLDDYMDEYAINEEMEEVMKEGVESGHGFGNWTSHTTYVETEDGKEHEVEVSGIFDADEYIFQKQVSVVADNEDEAYEELGYIHEKEYDLVDVLERKKSEDFQKMTPSEFVPFDQMQEELGQMWDETTAPLADAHNYDYEPSNEPSNANFSAETSTKQGWEITHYGDKRIAKKDGLSVYIEKLSHNSIQHKRDGANWRVTYGRYFDDGSGGRIIPLAELFRTYNDIFTWLNNPPFTIHNHAETFEATKHHGKSKHKRGKAKTSRSGVRQGRTDEEWRGVNNRNKANIEGWEDMDYAMREANTVGSPSPSGPSSVPEPAEATGSEPSNEHMKAEGNAKLAMGLTLGGLGLALVLGKDRLGKLFDKFNL